MILATVVAPEIQDSVKPSSSRRQIRGSSLLVVGQFLSKAINFAVQVLIVRYLTKSDYGAFGYALSIVALGESVATFGLDRAITRYVPIFQERRDYDKMFGTILIVITTILSLGLVMTLTVYGLQDYLNQTFINDQLAMNLLLTLIFLAPVQAIDDVLVGLFAVFVGSRAIFFRKHLLAPCLKLSVVLLLIWGGSNVFFLAGGYLAAGVIGIGAYIIMLWYALRKQEIFAHFNLRTVSLPWLEILSFTIPLLTSDLVYVVMNSMDAVMVQYFHDATEVAAIRAVQPTAKLNQMVLASFGILFTPMAARLFARNDREGINTLYWQNAIWIAVASFPIFVLTFSLAQPITLLLFGERYEQSALLLALLSFSYYFNAALGQNGLTLKVFGMVRYIVVINGLAVVANLVANVLLIPRYGALGAAIGTAGTLVLHNILKQAGLAMGTGINLFDWRYFRAYLIIIVSTFGLLFVQWLTAAPAYISIGMAVITSLIVVRTNRHLLNIEQTFPELLRLPLVKVIFR